MTGWDIKLVQSNMQAVNLSNSARKSLELFRDALYCMQWQSRTRMAILSILKGGKYHGGSLIHGRSRKSGMYTHGDLMECRSPPQLEIYPLGYRKTCRTVATTGVYL